MKQIFISYSSKEYNEALRFRNAFAAKGIECWMAPSSIPVGSNYAIEIPKAIKSCKVVVFIMSEISQSSVWVQKEIGLAISNGKPVIPVVIDNCSVISPFDFFLTDVQMIPGDNPEQLVAVVSTMIGADISSSESIEYIEPQVKTNTSDLKKTITDKLSSLKNDAAKPLVASVQSKIEQFKQNVEENKQQAAEAKAALYWFCPQCGNKNNDSIQNCSKCGYNKPTYWYCPECGTKNISSTEFCYKCQTANPEKKPVEETAPETIEVEDIISWYCSKCGTGNSEDYAFCKNCGDEKPYSWICPECSFVNYNKNSLCSKCGAGETVEEVTEESDAVAETVVENEKSYDWLCSECGTGNPDDYMFCKKCGSKKMAETAAAETVEEELSEKDIITEESTDWYCSECGTGNPEDYLFCKNCGSKKAVEAVAAETVEEEFDETDIITEESADWYCSDCSTGNPDDYMFCKKCGSKKAVETVTAEETKINEPEKAELPEYDPVVEWLCPRCNTVNGTFLKFCLRCHKAKPESRDIHKNADWLCTKCGTYNSKYDTSCINCSERKQDSAKAENDDIFWQCPVCDTKNLDIISSCVVCGADNPDYKNDMIVEKASSIIPETTSTESSNWTCSYCHALNYKAVRYCYKCDAPRYGTSLLTKLKEKPDPNWFCAKCGAENAPHAVNCQECGEKKQVSASVDSANKKRLKNILKK